MEWDASTGSIGKELSLTTFAKFFHSQVDLCFAAFAAADLMPRLKAFLTLNQLQRQLYGLHHMISKLIGLSHDIIDQAPFLLQKCNSKKKNV